MYVRMNIHQKPKQKGPQPFPLIKKRHKGIPLNQKPKAPQSEQPKIVKPIEITPRVKDRTRERGQ
jgi:hypothetical protein